MLVVFCHNDAQPMNCIYNSQDNSIGLIDFEYACYNYRGWDIGNHFCEYTSFNLDYTRFPTKEKQLFFIERYFLPSFC